MSATNTTTNYNLPIFIGSDKPAWLVDFNGAMNAIDAQMKVNADAIAGKSPILTFNDTTDIDFTRTGDVITANLASGVSDKVGRALVTPLSAPAAEQIVAIDTNGVQAAMEIGSGLFNDNGTLKAIDLNMSSQQHTPSVAGATLGDSRLYSALNADSSAGKVYGFITITPTSTGNKVINTGITVTAPDEAYDIYPAGIIVYGDQIVDHSTVSYHIDTSGNVTITFYALRASKAYIYLWPTLYFFSDFGDSPLNP